MLTKIAKICILTIVILAAFWATAAAKTTAETTTTTTTTATAPTITNDLHSSHAPLVVSAHAGGEMNRNETKASAKTLPEIQPAVTSATTTNRIVESASSNTPTASSSTSTATPTTTATTSTTTTTTVAITTAAPSLHLATTTAEPSIDVATTTAAPYIDVATTTASATAAIEEFTAIDKLDSHISTDVPPLAALGSVFDRLYRIKELHNTEPEPDAEPEAVTEAETESEAETDNDNSSESPLNIQMQAAASYQVAETLADLNDEERARYGALLAQPTASKLNIVDLYPMKPDDFQPIIRSDNAELLKKHTIFTRLENPEEYRQNLMPNEVEMHPIGNVNQAKATTTTTTTTRTPPTTTTTLSSLPSTDSDFTGKLLAEQDDLITEIERKFQLHETTTLSPTRPRLLPGDSFIDRRVKKSFEFPIVQHRASDVMALPHIDFANTKFNTDATDNHEASSSGGSASAASSASHPEFSTTKFYNSKELYNERSWLNTRKLIRDPESSSIIKPSSERSPIEASETTKLKDSTTAAAAAAAQSTTTATAVPQRVTLRPTAESFDGATATTAAASTTAEATPIWTTTVKPMKYQKQLKRAKLLLKALTPTSANTGVGSDANADVEKLEVVAAKVKITAAATSTATDSAPATTTGTATETTSSPGPELDGPTHRAVAIANLAKSASKPIARPRILSRLQEKINSLECEILNVPQDSHLWRGNETHELLLPIVTTEHCLPGEHCTPTVLTWEGEAEIQSGDILIVEINDAMLNTEHQQNNTTSQSAAHAAQVYQVTRSGHEHCDVTEGVLLDITPLVVDGRKLVTLYDKDLTEGVNLLIVVSEQWGAQCVRLKVTTKTDNCGENADCSGKGVCYSNGAMEEYECQCCSGFAGPHCEEIDACNPSPCTNNGICVDLSQGHEGNSYQCLCPYGYAGKNCQYESDPCNPAECLNGGSCVGNSTHFRCDCTPGYTGPLCQHSLNECESSPCVHGICVDQEDGFRCFCQPGFAGELCNFEYNECESNPCQNSGECIDHIGSYECRCTKGYTGTRCQIKVDFCANKPCPEGHRCIDHGNDFSCECPGGRNGPDCNQMPRTYFQQCSVNPCTHGGTCWSSGDSFYCACRPGYTGTMCEDEFVVETVVSSSEFIVDDVNARNFNDKTFGSSVVLKSPIELHNAYFAAGVLAAAIFIVAVVVTICHCKVNQTYRKFSTRSSSFIPILGFGRRTKMQGKLNKHWLSGKGLNATGAAAGGAAASGSTTASCNNSTQQSTRHLPQKPNGSSSQTQTTLGGQLHERPFQRHLAMNLENDMYYTVDFSENSQHSPLIQ